MSKLFKLKEWLTIPDAARHLSGVFGEEVSEADVLRLGLDGHLTLSVDFVNGTSARLGKVVSEADAEVKIMCRDIANPLMREARDIEATVGTLSGAQGAFPEEILKAFKDGTLFWYITDLRIGDETYVHLEDKVSCIRDVWDLAFIGSEGLDVEHHFQQFTGGPEITGVCIDGTFVRRDDGTFASLQESFNSPEMKDYLKGFEKSFEAAMTKAGNTMKPRKDRPRDHPDNFFPAGKLPDDGVLVVRTSALTELQSKMAEDSAVLNPPKQSTREKNTLLRIIGLMVNHRYGKNIKAPYSIASLLTDKAKDLGITLGSEATANHIKAALDLVKKDGLHK